MNLLERDAPLHELQEALQAVMGGNGRIVLISGEAGIGKTSLVEKFTGDQKGLVRVLWGVCDAMFTPRPLGPLHDMAAQISVNLSRLLNADANRTAIFSAALSELQDRPTIAVFEDLHWADEPTLDLLRFLGRRIARTTALLVLTYRDDELGLQHPLRTLLGDLGPSATTCRLSLQPLTETAVRTLVGERNLDAAGLHCQTGGNPFFVTEVLAGAGDGLPPTIRDAVLARTARLSPPAQAVLQAAAVIGSYIEPWLLAGVTGAETQAADECLTSGILQVQEEILAFRHELSRQAVLETIPLHQRIAWHGQVLKALQVSPTGRSDLARLAYHAGAAGDRDAVLEFAPAAARQASTDGAHRAAADLYALALRYADELPLAEHALLLEAHAHENKLIDNEPTAIADRRQAIKLWQAAGNRLKVGENLAYLAIALAGIDRAEAEQASQAAIEVLANLPAGRELALAYRTRALVHVIEQEYAEALALAHKAVALVEQVGNPLVLAMAYDTMGLAWIYLDYERGCEVLHRCLEIATGAGLDARVATVYSNLGSASCRLYRFSQAESYLAQGIAYTTERDLDLMRLYMLAWRALTLLYLGHWHEAENVAAEVLRRIGISPHNRFPAMVALARLRTRRGEPDADHLLDEALELATPSGYFQHIVAVRLARAEAAWWSGDRERTLEEVRPIYERAICKRQPWVGGELAFWRWQAGEAVETPAWMAKPFALQITGDWRAAAAAWEHLGCPYEQARALADGDPEAQIAALAICEQLGARPLAEFVRQKLRQAGIQIIPRGPRAATRENPFGLTKRQVEILALLTEHLTNAQIAARLHISAKTVDHHVSAVLAKLDVHSRDEAAGLARQHPHFTPLK